MKEQAAAAGPEIEQHGEGEQEDESADGGGDACDGGDDDLLAADGGELGLEDFAHGITEY